MKTIRYTSYIFTFCALFFSCSHPKEKIPDTYFDPVADLYDSTLMPFYHGVASGDPLADRVIIWTRVTPTTMMSSVKVKWEIAEDSEFNPIYKSDTLSTNIQRNFTVKVDVGALQPNHVYYYRFNALGKNSITGRTKTTPVEAIDSLRFAVVSGSNWEWGYFNAYDKIADRPALNAVIHLGDYIYEDAVGIYGDTTIGRFNFPAHEVVTLQDYRTRYSQYHTDKGLRRARQQHPFITIWDDHEIANNSYMEGAQNHRADEEHYEVRKKAARQAYYEWIPIRENGALYRSISFGPLADLFMPDEWLTGRSKQVNRLDTPDYNNEDRSMPGATQLEWFENRLESSKASWKLIGTQVIFSDIDLSQIFPRTPQNLDAWDGYPFEKNRIKNHIQSGRIKDVLFLTGGMHASWAIEVATDVINAYDPVPSQGAFAVEFGTPSISAANSNEHMSDDEVIRSEKKLMEFNSHIKYYNNRDHGYVILTLTKDQAASQWFYVETLRKEGSPEYPGKEYSIERGSTAIR